MTIVWLALSSILWGALVVGVAAAIQSTLRTSGAIRQWLWRGSAVLLILPWLAAPFTAMLPHPHLGLPEMMPDLSGRDLDVTFTAAPIGNATLSAPHVNFPWPEVLLVIVVAGWIWRIAAAHRARSELRRILATSCIVEQGSAAAAVRIWSQKLGLNRRPELRVADVSVSPFSFGFIRPVICLPKSIEISLSQSSLELIIAHECLHVARGDGWLRPLERVIADLVWFNPFAWRIRRELDLARELACDEAILDQAIEPVAYARVLRDVAGLVVDLDTAAPAASMSLSGGGRVLSLRMKRTLGYAGRLPGRLALGAVALLVIVGAPVAVAQAVLAGPQAPSVSAPPAPPPPVVPALPPRIEPPAPVTPPRPRADLIAPPPPATPADLQLRALFNARVTKVASDDQRGLYVVVEQIEDGKSFGASDARGCMVETPHLARVRVQKGQTVQAGEVIGEFAASETGRTTAFCKTFDPDRVPGPTTTPAKYVAPPAVRLPGGGTPVLLQPAHLSSPYGSRLDPFTKMKTYHEGVDLAASLGAAVHTPSAGKVTYAGPKPSLGNVVEMSVGNDYTLRFAHLGDLAVKEGDQTNAGDTVGVIGMDGRSTGAHVHFEVFWKGHSYDPQTITGLVLIGAK